MEWRERKRKPKTAAIAEYPPPLPPAVVLDSTAHINSSWEGGGGRGYSGPQTAFACVACITCAAGVNVLAFASALLSVLWTRLKGSVFLLEFELAYRTGNSVTMIFQAIWLVRYLRLMEDG